MDSMLATMANQLRDLRRMEHGRRVRRIKNSLSSSKRIADATERYSLGLLSMEEFLTVNGHAAEKLLERVEQLPQPQQQQPVPQPVPQPQQQQPVPQPVPQPICSIANALHQANEALFYDFYDF
jgi:hypothetical protein